jgi:PAS domain S-box-containing protein
MDSLVSLLGRNGFLPHGYCFTWSPGLLWSMVGADAVIAAAYFSIPVATMSYVRRRPEASANWLAWMFSAFIFSCGVTHVMDIWTIWQPDYALQALSKVATAAISLVTAIALWPLIPRALKIPSVQQLQTAIADLKSEVGRRRSAEDEVAATQQSLAVTLASIEAGFIATDRKGKVTRMNAVAEMVTGWRQCDAVGLDYWTVFDREGQSEDDRSRSPLDALADLGITATALERVVAISRAGKRTPLDVKAALTRSDIDGQVTGLAVIFWDMSRIVRAETETNRLAAIVESSNDAIIGQTLDGTITSWNAAAQKLYGYCPAEAIGQSTRLILPPDREGEQSAMLAGLAQGEVQPNFETVRRAKDGSLVEVSVTLSPILDGDKRIVGASKIARDVSFQRKGAAALRDTESLLRTINLHSIMSVVDRAGRIVDANEAFCRISGYDRDELLGQTHHIIKSGVQSSEFWLDMWRTIGAGQPWRGEICNRAKDGTLYWVDSLIAPLVGADGGVEKYISIRTDITAAKLTEQRLRANEAFLDRAGSIAGIGGWELDLRTGAVFWSAHTYRIHELDPGQQPPLDEALNFYAPEARPVIERALADAMAHGQGWDLELPFVTARGRAIWVRTVGTVELLDGKPVRMVGAFQDITARRQTEATLRETNERFALATDAAAIGVWEFDVPSSTLVWDDWMYQLYGVAPGADAEPYALWAQSLDAADRARCESLIAVAMAGGGEFDTEFRIVRPDGEVRTLKAASRTVRAADGTALRMTGVNFDITELKRTEARLLETSSKLRSVLDAASEVSIIATDPDLKIQLFNTGAERLLGYASEELVGHATPICIHDADELRLRGDELSARLGRPVEGGAVFTEPSALHCPREWTYVRKDGSRVEVSLVVTAMRDDDDTLLGYLGVAHDVTLQKRLEGSLRHATSKAEQASRAKSEFLANMSHEIRTPLNAVVGLSYVLRRMGLDVEQEDCVAKIELAGKSLLGVVNDVLDLSKVEAGALVIEHTEFSPRDLLQDLAAVMTAQAHAKGIAIEFDIPHDLPDVLAGDARRLSQILLNLVANAIKFTERGLVCLRVRQLGASAEAVTLSFVVQDTGIGIAPEVQSRLFAPFTQADASITRRFGGTGLGLSIVRRLARLMGGEVSLNSTPGVGSEFTVVLDFALTGPKASVLQDDAAGPFGAGALLGVRVLVVDDSPINREVAKRILELSGAHVELAEDGQQAIDCLRVRPDEFDVVLMDVQMPVLDGLEATRRIRLEPGLTGLAVIALTAGALSSEHERARAAGMDDFIAKPFEVEALVATILHRVRPERLQQPTAISEACAAPAVLAWPKIAGIDTADAQTRLVGDRGLFLTLLQQLLDEFSGMATPAPHDDSAALARHAAGLHRLGGSAGMLGARSVRELAGAAEAACHAGDAGQAAALAIRCGSELQSLRQSAATELSAAEARAEEAPPDGQEAFEPERVAELIELLQRKSLSALDRFSAMSGPLRQYLGKDVHTLVRDNVEQLKFEDAVTALVASGVLTSTEN